MPTVLPSVTRISASTPAAGDGISASTLSVDISNSGSSRLTESPTFLSHLVMVPSAMLSPIWGMITSTLIGSAPCFPVSVSDQFLYRLSHLGGIRHVSLFQRRTIRDRRVERRDPHDRA